MTDPTIVVERGRARATVFIDRQARRNAVDRATVIELGRIVADLADDAELCALVLRGRGETFCAGADAGDLEAVLGQTDDELTTEFRGQLSVLDALQRSGVVTVAAVRGAALGFGVALAASCDLVIASDDARFGLPEIKLGMAPAMVLPSLMRRVTPSAALRLAVGARTISAHEAAAAGLVDTVVAADSFETEIEALASELTAHDPAATRQAVRIVRGLDAGRNVDIATESCRAVRSPAVASALARFG